MIADLNKMLGRLLVVGLTYLDDKGEVTGKFQYYGTVINVNENGVTVQPPDTEQAAVLPAIPEAYNEAFPGRYEFVSLGTYVDDPDYTCSFSITPE